MSRHVEKDAEHHAGETQDLAITKIEIPCAKGAYKKPLINCIGQNCRQRKKCHGFTEALSKLSLTEAVLREAFEKYHHKEAPVQKPTDVVKVRGVLQPTPVIPAESESAVLPENADTSFVEQLSGRPDSSEITDHWGDLTDEEIDDIVEDIRQDYYKVGVAVFCRIGELLFVKVFGNQWENLQSKNPMKESSFRKIAEHPQCPLSKHQLFSAIHIYRICTEVLPPELSGKLSSTHLIALCKAKDPKDTVRFAEKAIEGNLSSRQIKLLIKTGTAEESQSGEEKPFTTAMFLKRMERLDAEFKKEIENADQTADFWTKCPSEELKNIRAILERFSGNIATLTKTVKNAKKEHITAHVNGR
jgi:hypothetical protein